jgi:chemotaxis protein CheD
MGEIGVARQGESLRTLLGSCLGLILYDQRRQLGGLAHILLPDSAGDSRQPGKYVDTAVPCLMAEMNRLAAGRLVLQAKLFGAASMFSTSIDSIQIGEQNLLACKRILDQLKIPIVASHCGGNHGRRITFNVSTGVARVEIVGQPPIEL